MRIPGFAVAFVLAVGASGVRAATAEQNAVMAVVRNYDAAYNAGNAQAAAALCADDAVIIDDFAPHLWKGAAACADWARDLAAFDAANKVTGDTVTLGEPWHVDVDGDAAYVVVPATDANDQDGKHVVTTGSVWTFVLKKTAAGWRIASWAWAVQ